MLDYKSLLGAAAVIIGLAGYAPYIRDTISGKTKPHIFSWFIWSLLTGIAFFAQISKGAGAGSWITAVSSIFPFIIAVLAFKQGEKEITRTDWMCFIASLVGIALWIATDNPLLAVILVTIADSVAGIPTIRKAYFKPHEETLTHYVFASIKFMLGLLALESLSLTTWLYPASLVLMNALIASLLIIRRKQLATSSASF